MKNKKHASIKMYIMIPVLILGIVSIISNAMAIMNIRNVNANASNIADNYMTGISDLGIISYYCNKCRYHDQYYGWN